MSRLPLPQPLGYEGFTAAQMDRHADEAVEAYRRMAYRVQIVGPGINTVLEVRTADDVDILQRTVNKIIAAIRAKP